MTLSHAFLVKILVGALIGAGTSALTDLHAAMNGWKNWGDAWSYDWSLATFRWFQGALSGFALAAGISPFTA